jgi:hypothetical protein
MRHVSDGVNVNQHPHAGHKQQPDAGERIQQESNLRGKLRPASLGRVRQIPGVAAQPGVENFLEPGMLVRWRPHLRVIQHGTAGKQERQYHRADTDEADRRFRKPAPQKEHRRRAHRGQQRNHPDVVEKEHDVFSTQQSVNP